MTLTYKPDEIGENFLRYTDVQKFFKRMRAAGYQFRYVIAGEMGGEKGRPHWHAIIFWQNTPPVKGPVIRVSDAGVKMRDFQYWPHGHTVIDENFSAKNVRYVAKYIQKAEGVPGKFVASKRPGIGQNYFEAHALRQAKASAPWPRNEFIVEGWRASLSPARWKRYKQTTVEAMQEKNNNGWYHLNAYQDELTKQDRKQAIDWEVSKTIFASKYFPTLIKNWAKGAQYFNLYKLGKQYAVAWSFKELPKWLSGNYRSLGAMSSQETGLEKPQERIELKPIPLSGAMLISPEQAQAMIPTSFKKIGVRPEPTSNPASPTQWVTDRWQELAETLEQSFENSLPLEWCDGVFSAKQSWAKPS